MMPHSSSSRRLYKFALGDIARECGFASPTYFCDFCRRTFGLALSAWRADNIVAY